jgi:hypothetical protein
MSEHGRSVPHGAHSRTVLGLVGALMVLAAAGCDDSGSTCGRPKSSPFEGNGTLEVTLQLQDGVLAEQDLAGSFWSSRGTAPVWTGPLRVRAAISGEDMTFNDAQGHTIVLHREHCY